jgi:hypothetical protein
MDPVVARKTWRTAEPLHALIYFAAEATEEYAAVGLSGGRMGYFASRAAAFGPVSAEVVIATFYNFNPSLVRSAIPRAWDLATPVAVLEARRRAASRALRRGLGSDLSESELVVEAAELTRRAAEAACEHVEGRPLFATHAGLDWPEADPLLRLWHAQTLLREFRGDGHVACLLTAELDPVEALVMHEASGELPPGVLRASRAWGHEDWAAGVERLRRRGLVTVGGGGGELEGGGGELEGGAAELALTEAGASLRQRIEDETDARSVPAYGALGEDGCDRFRQVARPLSQAVVAAGMLNPAAMARLSDDE